MVDGALGFVDVTCSGLARLNEWTPAQFQNHVALVLEERRRRARGEISQGHLVDVIKAAGDAMCFGPLGRQIQGDAGANIRGDHVVRARALLFVN